MKRRMRRSEQDELLVYAREYLSSAFPNPSHDGCPEDAALRALADNPKADVRSEEHISFCSPCLVRYLDLLELLRTQENYKSTLSFFRASSSVIWLGTFLLALLVLTSVVSQYLHQRSKNVLIAARNPNPSSKLVIDLEPFSNERDSEQGSSEAIPPLKVPRRPTDLVLELPLGSDEGAYDVAITLKGNKVWGTVVPTKSSQRRLFLEIHVNFDALAKGNYVLAVKNSLGTGIQAPIILEDANSAYVREPHSRLSSSLLDTVLVSRNWFSRNRQHFELDQGENPNQLLAAADHYAWLGNAAIAGPLYVRAENAFHAAQDEKGELYARVGRIRAEAESMPFERVSLLLGELLRTEIVQADPQLKLRYLTAKGYTDLDIDPLSARREWEEAERLSKQLGDKEREARASGELGIISFLEGNGSTAKKLVGHAFMSAVLYGDVGAQVRYLSMFGNALNELKRFDEALEYFNRALKLVDQTPDIGFPFMAYEGKAQALIGLSRPAQAKSLLSDALSEARRLGRRGHESQLSIVLGNLDRTEGKYSEAIKYWQSATEIARDGQFYRMQAEAMFQLASLYRSENQFALAEQCLEQGVSAGRTIGDRFYLPRDIAALAEIKNLQGNPRAAEELYDQATDILDALLVNSASPYAKSSIVDAMSEIYLKHFALAARMKDVAKSFEIVERARGRSVADLLRSPNKYGDTTLNETTEDRLITVLQLRLLQSVSGSERKRLLADLFEAEQKRELETTRPASPFIGKAISITKVRHVLRSDETLIEYIVGDADCYALVLNRKGEELVRLRQRSEVLQQIIRRYLDAVRLKQDTHDDEALLYSILIAPIQQVQKKSRLVFVPDGFLNLMPFDSLRDSKGKYLLYSHVVSYAPSATVLYLLRIAHRSQLPTLPFLGIGDVSYKSMAKLSEIKPDLNDSPRGVYDLAGAHFSELPGTRAEILAAEQVFGKASVALLGAFASEAAFKAEPLSKFKIIHFAVHGLASPKYPERAALVLSADPKGREDGLLQVREIAMLSLNADLVTLSACETGVGRLQGEEGVISMERAFLSAGARAVVATLWSADDTFSAALIKSFYVHLAEHEDVGSALRNAKIEMIRKLAEAPPPYYWAGFTINGESASSISMQ